MQMLLLLPAPAVLRQKRGRTALTGARRCPRKPSFCDYCSECQCTACERCRIGRDAVCVWSNNNTRGAWRRVGLTMDIHPADATRIITRPLTARLRALGHVDGFASFPNDPRQGARGSGDPGDLLLRLIQSIFATGARKCYRVANERASLRRNAMKQCIALANNATTRNADR